MFNKFEFVLLNLNWVQNIEKRWNDKINFYLRDICGQCYKTFYGRKLRLFIISKSVVPGKPFQPSLIFVGKDRGLP